MSDLIEAYLDDLLGELRGPAAHVRRMLAETEAHLREATDEGVAGGLDRSAAERAAVDRFGPPAEVARTANAGATARTLRRLAAPAFVAAVRLGAVALVAVGITGLAAAMVRGLAGTRLLYGTGLTFPYADCAHWRAVQPGARSCAQAYLMESADDALVLRGAAGVLGVVLVVALAVVLRRNRGLLRRLPAALEPAVGAALFLAAGLGMLAFGLSGATITGGPLGVAAGTGQWLVSGSVAIIAGVAYAGLLLRRLTAPIPER